MVSSREKQNSLALAAVFWFAPFVQYFLVSHKKFLNEASKDFVKSYILIWYTLLFFLFLAICSYITWVLQNFYLWIDIALLILQWVIICMIVWTIAIFAEKKIFSKNIGIDWNIQATSWNKTGILLSFLPGYNYFLRFKFNEFNKPVWWLKESILWRTFFAIVIIFAENTFFQSFLLIIIIFRISSLLSGLDIIDNRIKTFFNKLFVTNIEEILAFVVWTLKWIFFSIKQNNFNDLKKFINSSIAEKKLLYSNLHNINLYNIKSIFNKWVYIQHLCLWLMLLYLLHDMSSWDWRLLFNWFRYIGLWLIMTRYLILYYYKKINELPLLTEIINYINNIIWYICF